MVIVLPAVYYEIAAVCRMTKTNVITDAADGTPTTCKHYRTITHPIAFAIPYQGASCCILGTDNPTRILT